MGEIVELPHDLFSNTKIFSKYDVISITDEESSHWLRSETFLQAMKVIYDMFSQLQTNKKLVSCFLPRSI